MTDHEFKGRDDARDRIIVPIKVGLMVGAIAIALPCVINFFIEQHFWNLVIGYNYTFSTTLSFLYIALFTIGSLFVGGESCRRVGAEIRNENDAILAGIVSGAASYFLFIGVMISTNLIFSNATVETMGLIPSTNIFAFLLYLIIVIISFAASVVIQIVGSLSYYSYKTKSGKSLFNALDSRPGTLIIKHLNCIISLLILLIIFVPVGIVYTEMRMDLIDPSNIYADIHWNVASVEWLSTDTLVITVFIDERNIDHGVKNPFIDPTPGFDKPRFIILYNSKDLSDQAIIDKEGLSDIIDPPEGLQYVTGSRVVLKGADISNSTSSGHLVILDFNPTQGGTRAPKNVIIDMKI